MHHSDRSFRDEGDITKLMQPGRERTQDLQGFDDDYTDIVDYIVRCTHKIWEEGGMGLLYTHYQHNSAVHTAYGMTYGREAMLAASINTLSAFPDRKAFADDVIWTGNDVDGFHTSHRITSLARNTGYSKYGPPTNRKVCYATIANCYVKENRIVEEWLVRDESTTVRQLGLDPHQVARKLAEQDAERGVQPFAVGEIRRITGQTTPAVMPSKEGDGFDVEDFVRRSTHEIWNWRLFNKIYDNHVPNYLCATAGNRRIYGLGDYQAYVMALLVMFPDAHMQIDHMYWLGNDDDGYRVASRWSLLGTHDGPGIYGEPTGQRVNIMGITHFLVKHGKFQREWTVFDEIAVLKQIYAGRLT